jgi:mono/diheme cytochrome c family protein
MAADKYDRNAQVWALQRSGFASGWQRGQEIYFMRCWMCHNDYTVTAEPTRGVSLRHLYAQAKTPEAQQAVTDRVRRQIRSGSARMPGYTAEAMSDADVEDLVLYLREKCGTYQTGSGCFDEHNPPPNPNYKHQ